MEGGVFLLSSLSVGTSQSFSPIRRQPLYHTHLLFNTLLRLMPRVTTRSRSSRATKPAAELKQPKKLAPKSAPTQASHRKTRQSSVPFVVTPKGSLYDTIQATHTPTPPIDLALPLPEITARSPIPLLQPESPVRISTRETILQVYNDVMVDRLSLGGLIDLLQNCVAVFDLSPMIRQALFRTLATINTDLVTAGLYTPPPTPIKQKIPTAANEMTKFPVLESPVVPLPPILPSPLTTSSSQPHSARHFSWTERRFSKSSSGSAASLSGSAAEAGVHYLSAKITDYSVMIGPVPTAPEA
ncbi:hypothetical protein JCM10908_005078 [Rhodotorula pacifica]|uniref:uncharacterized protein n=1 Tax=Rhodotorula pacifica TaxID=1495444 RepID=UPI00317AA3D7